MPPKYQKREVSNPQNKPAPPIKSDTTAYISLIFKIEILCSNSVTVTQKSDSRSYSREKIDLKTGEFGYNTYSTENTYENVGPVFRSYADYVDLLIDGKLVDEGDTSLQSRFLSSKTVTDSDGDFQYSSSTSQYFYMFKTEYRTHFNAEVKKSLFGGPKAVFLYTPEVKVIFYNNTEPYECDFSSAMEVTKAEIKNIGNKWVAQKEIDVKLSIPQWVLSKMKKQE